MSRPSIETRAFASAVASVRRVWISPKATVLTLTRMRPHSFDRRLDEALGEVGCRHVAPARDRLRTARADLAHHLFGDLGLEIVDDDLRALGRELQGQRPADAPARPAHQRNLAVQLAILH